MRSISRRNSVSEGVSVRDGFVMVLLRARDKTPARARHR
jgi:hypothetical protein